MRGTVSVPPVYQKGGRITPARAGNSSSPLVKNMVRHGSPPRVRGTDGHGVWYFDRRRITPARAGNRSRLLRWFAGCWDHPRACGEQVFTPAVTAEGVGSPPRVRGTGQLLHFSKMLLRITPARAGNRDGRYQTRKQDRDHPRACGEQPCNVIIPWCR